MVYWSAFLTMVMTKHCKKKLYRRSVGVFVVHMNKNVASFKVKRSKKR